MKDLEIIENTENTQTSKFRKRIRSRKKKRRILLLALAVCILAGVGGGVVWAKYYSVNSREGISVASGLYFGSNRLTTVRGQVTDMEKIKTEDTASLPVNVNTSKWSGGGTTTFDIEIRNYENHLLYNDASLNMGYEVQFMMLGDTTSCGANYYVQKKGDPRKIYLHQEVKDGKIIGTDNFAKYTGRLPGGTLSADTYILGIEMVNDKKYEKNPAKVMAVAYPVAPDYVRNDSDQQNRLLGVFQGVYTSTVELSIDHAAFDVQDEPDYNDSSWKKKVKDLSGLLYNVKTKGDIVAGNEESITVKPQVIIRWKSDYLKISEYDQYYLEAKKQEKASSGETQKWYYDETKDGTKWTCMRVAVMPYTSIDVTFYKTGTFMNNDKMTKNEFESLVQAETVKVTN